MNFPDEERTWIAGIFSVARHFIHSFPLIAPLKRLLQKHVHNKGRSFLDKICNAVFLQTKNFTIPFSSHFHLVLVPFWVLYTKKVHSCGKTFFDYIVTGTRKIFPKT